MMSDAVPVECPYCGEPVELLIDTGGADRQEYVEDCPVCCRPWQVTVERGFDEHWSASLRSTDE